MGRVLQQVMMPASAVLLVLFLFLTSVCWFVRFEMTVAVSLTCGFCEKAQLFVFIGSLFVFATGIIPGFVLKFLRVRNVVAYLTLGVLSGLLAEYCYMFENEVWYSWDFTVSPIGRIITAAIADMPSLFLSMVDMQPYSAIPLAVGLLGSGLFWLIAVRRLPA